MFSSSRGEEGKAEKGKVFSECGEGVGMGCEPMGGRRGIKSIQNLLIYIILEGAYAAPPKGGGAAGEYTGDKPPALSLGEKGRRGLRFLGCEPVWGRCEPMGGRRGLKSIQNLLIYIYI